jgi:hypothetical protein
LDIANTPVFASLGGMFHPTKPLPLAEFIVMLAFKVSIVAMATDIMLPALTMIGEDLRVGDPNDVQLVVSSRGGSETCALSPAKGRGVQS